MEEPFTPSDNVATGLGKSPLRDKALILIFSCAIFCCGDGAKDKTSTNSPLTNSPLTNNNSTTTSDAKASSATSNGIVDQTSTSNQAVSNNSSSGISLYTEAASKKNAKKNTDSKDNQQTSTQGSRITSPDTGSIHTIDPQKKSIQRYQIQSNTLIFMIKEFQEGGTAPSLADYRRYNIYNIPEAKLDQLHQALLKKPFIDIDTVSKLSRWIHGFFPKHHIILTFGLASNTLWQDKITRGESDQLKFYGLEINDTLSEVTLFDWQQTEPLKRYNNLPVASDWRQRSLFLLETLKSIGDYIFDLHPASEYHWLSLIEEQPNGHFIRGQLNHSHLATALHYWTRTLRTKNLGVINIGHLGIKASYSDIDNFCTYSDWVIASDINRIDLDVYITDPKLNPLERIHQLAATHQSIEELFKKIIDLRKRRFDNAENLLSIQMIPQSVYLYSCQQFIAFKRQFLSLMKPYLPQSERGSLATYTSDTDLKTYITENSAGDAENLIPLLDNIYLRKADNRSQFIWTDEKNGMTMPNLHIIRIDEN